MNRMKKVFHGKEGLKIEELNEETNSFLSELNQEQKKAVLSRNKRLLVLEGVLCTP